MTDLTLHIDYLLLSHDCVILPGLGAVLAHSSSACIDVESGLAVPPKRSFTFSPALTESDGLLAWSVSKTRKINHTEAAAAVDAAVALMRRELGRGATVSLGKAGELTMQADGRLNFRAADLAPEALAPGQMWLPALPLVPVKEQLQTRAKVINDEGFNRRIWRKLAVAVLAIGLIAVGMIISIPVRFDNAQLASLLPSFKAVERTQSPASTAVELPGRLSAPVVLVLANHPDACETVDTAEYRALRSRELSVEPAAVAAEQASDAGRFCLVIASLGSTSEAEAYVARHSDMNLGILYKDGRVRVYAATGDTSADVLTKAKSLADRFPDAWVCRR